MYSVRRPPSVSGIRMVFPLVESVFAWCVVALSLVSRVGADILRIQRRGFNKKKAASTHATAEGSQARHGSGIKLTGP